MDDLQETLAASFPLVLLLTALAAAIIFFPSDLDIRQKASEPIPTITPQSAVPIVDQTPVSACSDLYSPVCGVNGITYDSPCEAESLNVEVAYPSPCFAAPIVTPRSVE